MMAVRTPGRNNAGRVPIRQGASFILHTPTRTVGIRMVTTPGPIPTDPGIFRSLRAFRTNRANPVRMTRVPTATSARAAYPHFMKDPVLIEAGWPPLIPCASEWDVIPLASLTGKIDRGVIPIKAPSMVRSTAITHVRCGILNDISCFTIVSPHFCRERKTNRDRQILWRYYTFALGMQNLPFRDRE